MIDDMTYDGKVVPGGPPQTRELSRATLRKRAVSEMSNNVYLLTDHDSGDSVLVDAADDWPAIAEMVTAAGGAVRAIVTTHQHWDHVRALADAVAATGATVLCGSDDADALPVPVDRRLEHGDTVAVGALRLDVVHLRGHTPGSVALALTDDDGTVHLLTGDSLFPGGVGATNRYPYQSFPQLIDDVEERVFDVYDDRTLVYPGHGDDTVLGVERPHLAEWRARGW